MKRWMVGLVGLLVSWCGLKAYADFQTGLDAALSRNYVAAYDHWAPLAEQGDARAQAGLGWLYSVGRGVPEDDTEAVKWFHLAAEQGYARAQYNLSWMYLNKEGVAEDHVRAYAWANLAAAQGNKSAASLKVSLRKSMTRGQIAEAQKLSRTLFSRIQDNQKKQDR
jgi:TPR repeat protein